MVSTKIIVIGAVVVLATTAITLGLVFGLKNDDPEKEDDDPNKPDDDELKPPTNLRVEVEAEKLKISWSDENDREIHHGIYYRIEALYSDNMMAIATGSDPFHYIIKPVECTGVQVVVSCLAPLSGLRSEGAVITYNNTSIDNIVVSNLQVSEQSGTLMAKWEYPRFPLELCNAEMIQYEVRAGNQIWQTLYFEILLDGYIDFKPCHTVDVSVVLVIDGIRPTSRVTETYEIALPDGFGADFEYEATVGSVGDANFITMTWELHDIGLCAVEYVVSCSDDDSPGGPEQINTPSFDFKSCPILYESGHTITVTIQPRLPGVAPEVDRDGLARICEFYASYQSDSWVLTGDCISDNRGQYVVNAHKTD